MDLRLLLVVLFFVGAFCCWLYAWHHRDQPSSLAAFRYSCLFEVAGFVLLIFWRATT